MSLMTSHFRNNDLRKTMERLSLHTWIDADTGLMLCSPTCRGCGRIYEEIAGVVATKESRGENLLCLGCDSTALGRPSFFADWVAGLEGGGL